MLYHLLARQMPYVPPGARVTNRTRARAACSQGPPTPLHELAPDVPAELVAICEKAMAREADERYADTLALAEDLRAYLEHRVVGAYETGAWAETRKWVERNKPLAVSAAAASLALVVGLVVSLRARSGRPRRTPRWRRRAKVKRRGRKGSPRGISRTSFLCPPSSICLGTSRI